MAILLKNDNKMRLIAIIILFLSHQIISQNQIYEDDATFFLADMQGSWSIGNPCGVGNNMIINCYDNMDMNNFELHLYNSNVTIHGDILNEGTILFLCDEAVLTVLGTTLDTEPEPTPTNPSNELKMYPNPATDIVTIDAAGISAIIFYDMGGRVVKQFITPTQRNNISISNLPSGVYLVQVVFLTSFSKTKKLIIK